MEASYSTLPGEQIFYQNYPKGYPKEKKAVSENLTSRGDYQVNANEYRDLPLNKALQQIGYQLLLGGAHPLARLAGEERESYQTSIDRLMQIAIQHIEGKVKKEALQAMVEVVERLPQGSGVRLTEVATCLARELVVEDKSQHFDPSLHLAVVKAFRVLLEKYWMIRAAGHAITDKLKNDLWTIVATFDALNGKAGDRAIEEEVELVKEIIKQLQTSKSGFDRAMECFPQAIALPGQIYNGDIQGAVGGVSQLYQNLNGWSMTGVTWFQRRFFLKAVIDRLVSMEASGSDLKTSLVAFKSLLDKLPKQFSGAMSVLWEQDHHLMMSVLNLLSDSVDRFQSLKMKELLLNKLAARAVAQPKTVSWFDREDKVSKFAQNLLFNLSENSCHLKTVQEVRKVLWQHCAKSKSESSVGYQCILACNNNKSRLPDWLAAREEFHWKAPAAVILTSFLDEASGRPQGSPPRLPQLRSAPQPGSPSYDHRHPLISKEEIEQLQLLAAYPFDQALQANIYVKRVLESSERDADKILTLVCIMNVLLPDINCESQPSLSYLVAYIKFQLFRMSERNQVSDKKIYGEIILLINRSIEKEFDKDNKAVYERFKEQFLFIFSGIHKTLIEK